MECVREPSDRCVLKDGLTVRNASMHDTSFEGSEKLDGVRFNPKTAWSECTST